MNVQPEVNSAPLCVLHCNLYGNSDKVDDCRFLLLFLFFNIHKHKASLKKKIMLTLILDSDNHLKYLLDKYTIHN